MRVPQESRNLQSPPVKSQKRICKTVIMTARLRLEVVHLRYQIITGVLIGLPCSVHVYKNYTVLPYIMHAVFRIHKLVDFQMVIFGISGIEFGNTTLDHSANPGQPRKRLLMYQSVSCLTVSF
jgi:hypothetical protein